MRDVLLKLKNKESLSTIEMTHAMEIVVNGQASDADIESFLLGLREKGETATEIVAAVTVMKKRAVQFSKQFPDLLDTCGTGGDSQRTLNVSTLAALVACAAGIKVAKHGNRSVSSVCGSADLLETLGVPIDSPVEAIESSIAETGFGFLFAPKFHPATRFAMPARKKIQGKTIFNILGPLSNPANVSYQLLGVYDERLLEIVANALKDLGVRRALVVHGADGLDEISTSAKTAAAELTNSKIKMFTIFPGELGIAKPVFKTLQCASKEEAKELALKVIKGDQGPAQDMVALNAGAALMISGKADTLLEGYRLAQSLLNTGEVAQKLKQIISWSQAAKQI